MARIANQTDLLGSSASAVQLDAKAQLAAKMQIYQDASRAPNTQRAYRDAWRRYCNWCKSLELEPLPPHPRIVALFITACAMGSAAPKGRPLAVSTIELQLQALRYKFNEIGTPLAVDKRLQQIMRGIQRQHARPPVQKVALLGSELMAMVATLDTSLLKGLRDRAILLLGFGGALRRSEIVGLDVGENQTSDGTGWITCRKEGLLLKINGKTGWRSVPIGRGSNPSTCPVAALEAWLEASEIREGAVFRPITRYGKLLKSKRLGDVIVAKLVKEAALAAGIYDGFSDAERKVGVSGHSLRAGLASSADAREAHVRKQLGHKQVQSTRIYRRRKRTQAPNFSKLLGL